MDLFDVTKAQLDGKRILMRVDFNVKFDDNGLPKNKYKIESVKETIDFILSKPGVKLALISHLGRPNGNELKYTFVEIYQKIAAILGRELVFANECLGAAVEPALMGLGDGQVLMLENVRFYGGEIEGDREFARRLSENFDVYVNEAFSVSHREHASITKVAEFLPSFAGLNFKREVDELSAVRSEFKNPAVAIVGGVKIETKLPMINFFSEIYDNVLVGSKIGLDAEDKNISFADNAILPQDYTGEGLDIGPETIKTFAGFIKDAETIVWNGALGKFEEEEFAAGTKGVVEAIVENKKAHKVAGGGETIEFLEKSGWFDEFDFVSTGGGAMLEFLVKGTLPGIEALKGDTLKD